MTPTADALWLDSFFSGYDSFLLGIAHKLAEAAGSVLTPFNRLISFLGERAILFLLIALVLLLFPRWRRCGLCIILSIGFGAVLTNLLCKAAVARPRPFEASDLYYQWWQTVGAPAESGFSFPSGHVTAAAAGVTGLCLTKGKRFVVPGIVLVLLMMFSRNYLMAHYPSDVLFAVLIGVFAAFPAAGVTALVYYFLERHSGDNRIYDLLLDSGLESFDDVKSIFRKIHISSRSENAAESASVSSSSFPEATAVTRRTKSESANRSHRSLKREPRSSSVYQGKH